LKEIRNDCEHIDDMADEDVDLSDIPEISAVMFARRAVRRGLEPVLRKSQITLRFDSDILKWYKHGGAGYQTKINSLLRAYMEAHKV
jgi:uncharacterized protein (DUF4415 family)